MEGSNHVWRHKIRENIKVNRDEYYVVYCPVNLVNEHQAHLQLVFVEDNNLNYIASKMEEEMIEWIKKYPVVTMATSFDDVGVKISLDTVRHGNDLLGYIFDLEDKIELRWYKLGDEAPFITQVSEETSDKVYKDIPYKTRDALNVSINEKIRERKNIKHFIDLSLWGWLIIAIIILYLGWKNDFVSIIAFTYSIYRTIKRFRALRGYPSLKEKEQGEIKGRKDHYYYHCEKNPNGFQRLVWENNILDLRAEIINERNNIFK